MSGKRVKLEKRKVSGKENIRKNVSKKKRVKIENLYIVVITIAVMSKAHFRPRNGLRPYSDSL